MPRSRTLNIPNLLSLFRILLIPVFIAIFYLPIPSNHLICAIIFAIAAFTDWLDGYLARRLNQMSRFGAFIDPVADKLIVAVALMILIAQESAYWFTVPAMIIVGREIVVSALREWMAELGKRTTLAVVKVAKYKTAVQMIAIFLLILANPAQISNFQQFAMTTGYALIYIAAILTLWSMIIYLKAAWPDLWESN